MRDLKEARHTRGLRQIDAARAAGVHQTTISRLERKVQTTSPERLQQILTAIENAPQRTEDEELVADLQRPVSELKAEAVAIKFLLEAIASELRSGGDREALGHLAELAIARQDRILAGLQVRVESLPGEAN